MQKFIHPNNNQLKKTESKYPTTLGQLLSHCQILIFGHIYIKNKCIQCISKVQNQLCVQHFVKFGSPILLRMYSVIINIFKFYFVITYKKIPMGFICSIFFSKYDVYRMSVLLPPGFLKMLHLKVQQLQMWKTFLSGLLPILFHDSKYHLQCFCSAQSSYDSQSETFRRGKQACAKCKKNC